MARIDLESVFKAYGNHVPVIRDVTLHIAEGEFCVFVGPSGCGKSTLLRMVAGLEEISGGTLSIGGQRMNDVPSAQRGVAMVFQSYALFPHMTVGENMGFGLSLAKTDKAVIEQKVGAAAKVLQLEHLLDRKPKALSGGQRQRVAIGRAIVRSPGVFLFDEPLSNLDAALRAQTRYEIARLHRSFGNASTIYVTHDQVEAMTLADRILLLNSGPAVAKEGSVAQCGSPLELYHHPRNLFVAGFIGSPRMNFLPGRVLGASATQVRVQLNSGETLDTHVDGSRLAPDAAVTVGVRPEHVDLGNATQHIIREVQWQERLGDSTFVYVKTDNPADPFVARAPGELRATTGARVAISLPCDALHVFDDQGLSLPRLAATTDMVLPEAA